MVVFVALQTSLSQTASTSSCIPQLLTTAVKSLPVIELGMLESLKQNFKV